MRIGIACLVSLFLAACGDDGGGVGTTDGGGNGDGGGQVDMYVPPAANCTPLDLASATAVPIMNQMVTPNPQGGTLQAGIFKLTTVKLYASGINVSGTAKSRVEFVTGMNNTGAARVALIIDATALGMPVQQNVTGAGLYTVTGTALNLTEGCGGMNPLSGLTYTATATNLMIWTSYMVTNPITLTIPIELTFVPE